jgi:hypothetical protein
MSSKLDVASHASDPSYLRDTDHQEDQNLV